MGSAAAGRPRGSGRPPAPAPDPPLHARRPPKGFVHAAFLSCDCRLERSNLFEDAVALLSKTAYPAAPKALGSLHHISLEALLAVLGALSSRCEGGRVTGLELP
jgi:hypothetical protein